MPTTYPKCSPTEMMGLLVLLNSHAGAEDIARLAEDLDLEADEILPSVDYAEVLQFMKVQDGRATLTETGKKFLALSIRDRKALLRDQLRKTTLFRTLLRALDGAPGHQLSDEELGQIVSLAQAPLEEAVQNIVNWGRYAELFRYDADEHRLIATQRPAAKSTTSSRPPPPSAPAAPPPTSGTTKSSKGTNPTQTRTSPIAVLAN
ncbi:MAG: AAA-associated domain-containing protein [Thermoplasmata archaeon]